MNRIVKTRRPAIFSIETLAGASQREPRLPIRGPPPFDENLTDTTAGDKLSSVYSHDPCCGEVGGLMPKQPKAARKKKAQSKRPRRKVPVSASSSRAADSIAVRNAQVECILDQEAVETRLPKEAMRWRYIVEHRRRWSNSDESSKQLAREARETFQSLGLNESQLATLAQEPVIEVRIPYITEDKGWAARLLPWEFLLSSATKRMRGTTPFLVTRHLDMGAAPAPRTPTSIAFVDAAPDRLAEQYDFEPEFQIVGESFADPNIISRLQNPTLSDLQTEFRLHPPDVVHLSVIDIRLARELLRRDGVRRSATSVRPEQEERKGWLDGVVFRDVTTAPFAEISAGQLATALASGNPDPTLVGFNTWFSASRMAPLALAEGVRTAIAFSTDFSDEFAEILFANFYRYWRLSGWDVLAGFLEAWNSLASYSKKLRGTGVVLWSRESLVAPAAAPRPGAPGRRARSSRIKPSDKARRDLAKRLEDERKIDLSKEPLHEVISVEVKPLKRLNYSLLHNNGNLFDEFVIRKRKPGRVRGIKVEVRLHVGQDSFPFRRTFELAEEALPLKDQIRLPLTSSLIRRVDENLATTIYTRVSCDSHTLYEDTHQATLLPVDQWTDTDENRRWLPSFVLPRDPAIRQLLSSGQRYLMCLTDDSAAGYDGYQQVDPSSDESLDVVDRQVQSIWTALLYEHPLAYVNPPPSYEWTSQRLRTPSQIFGESRGTCIDLALLLAACCEFIEIYPVIFLAEGHAYPGYWRSEEGYNDFISVQGVHDNMDQAELAEASRTEKLSWIADRSTYHELLNHVAAGDLVPVESTLVTSRTSFWKAIEEGGKNLRRKSDFHSMIDVRLARDCGITPLPLGDLS